MQLNSGLLSFAENLTYSFKLMILVTTTERRIVLIFVFIVLRIIEPEKNKIKLQRTEIERI